MEWNGMELILNRIPSRHVGLARDFGEDCFMLVSHSLKDLS
jgi:hypothetical protein